MLRLLPAQICLSRAAADPGAHIQHAWSVSRPVQLSLTLRPIACALTETPAGVERRLPPDLSAQRQSLCSRRRVAAVVPIE